MLGISLHSPQGFLINQGIASRKVWDGCCVELSIWNEKDKRPWIQGFVILTEEKIVNPLRNDERGVVVQLEAGVGVLSLALLEAKGSTPLPPPPPRRRRRWPCREPLPRKGRRNRFSNKFGRSFKGNQSRSRCHCRAQIGWKYTTKTTTTWPQLDTLTTIFTYAWGCSPKVTTRWPLRNRGG